MAKRFTDTELWEEDWFVALPKDYRIFWTFLKDSCDHAGIWKPNITKFNKLFDCIVDLDHAVDLLNKDKIRVVVLENGRWFICGFITFQYGSNLNENNRMHKSIMDILKVNNVFNEVLDLNLTSSRPQVEDTQRGKDKDIDKENVKDLDTTKKNIYSVFEETIFTLWNEFTDQYPVLPKIREISGKRREKIKKRFEVQSFRDFALILEALKKQDFLLGKNDRGWVASFDWLIENDTNYIKVLEEKYKGLGKEHFESPADRLTRELKERKLNATRS